MKILHRYWQSMFISIVFWCILNESFSPARLLEGVVVALIATFVINFLFKSQLDASISYNLSIIKLLKLILALFVNIYVSSLKLIKIILFHAPSPIIVSVQTNSTNRWHNCLIANAITLTPGTITLNLSNQEFIILWISPTTDNPKEIRKTLLGPFENALSERSSL